MDIPLKTKYVGAISLLIEIHANYVTMAGAAGETPDQELRCRILQCAKDFNAESEHLEVRPCGNKFGIFQK